MITKEGMMEPLLGACPSFQPSWEEFLEEWRDQTVELPIYLALGSFARHLVGMLARNETSTFPAVFDVVEQWHIHGDAYVKEAATVGLLEDLQNTNIHNSTTPEQFRVFLGPESVKWWDKLFGFWERGELMRDDDNRRA